MKRGAMLVLAAALASAPAAAAKKGSSSGEVLDIGLGARPLAMGGAYIAISDDLSAGQYNPAGLGAVRRYGLDLHYSDLYEGISYSGLTVGIPAPKRTTLGLSYYQLDSGSIPKTIASNRGLFLEDSGSFKVKDTLISATVGTGLYAPFEFGIAIKQLNESIDGVKGSGTLLDGGAILNLGSRFRVGASIQNIGGSLKFPDQNEDVPQIMGAGIAGKLLSNKNLTLAADFTTADNRGTRTSFGAEYVVMTSRAIKGEGARQDDVQTVYEKVPLFALRAGYQPEIADELGSAAGVTFGAGFYLGFIKLDYAFVDAGELGLTHRATMGFTFGRSSVAAERDDMDMRPSRKDDVDEKRAVPADKTKGGRYKLR